MTQAGVTGATNLQEDSLQVKAKNSIFIEKLVEKEAAIARDRTYESLVAQICYKGLEGSNV